MSRFLTITFVVVYSFISSLFAMSQQIREDNLERKVIVLTPKIKLKKQLAHRNTIYVVKDQFNLGQKSLVVYCGRQVLFEGETYYCSDKTVNVNNGETIIASDESILADSKLHKLSKGSYTASSNRSIYVLSKKETKIAFIIASILKIPEGSTVRFCGGGFYNGVIDFQGCTIEAAESQIFTNSLVYNVGNKRVFGRWFFMEGQKINSTQLNNLDYCEIDFGGLSLNSVTDINVSNARWRNVTLNAPMIIIGKREPIVSGFSISKTSNIDEYDGIHSINVGSNLKQYKGAISVLSFGEHVHYDWREENGFPTLYRGLATIIEEVSSDSSIIIEDEVEDFNQEYVYESSGGERIKIRSKGYIFEPCQVFLENCRFISSARKDPGFMYIYSGKDIFINKCEWIASNDGTPSLLGINNSVNGFVRDSKFIGAYYEGTGTSYGLQLFNSTRVSVFHCLFNANRRGVDISGNLCQSRYCVVENCTVVGNPSHAETSGLGSHSTSYGNTFRNNLIEGSSSKSGILTRGEYEIIEGNVFRSSFKAAAITCVENTIIRNNVCSVVPSSGFVWIESISRDDNRIIIENNVFKGTHLVRGQELLNCDVVIRNNTFYYTSSTESSFAPCGDKVRVSSSNNTIVKGNDKARLYYKYNTSLKKNGPENLGKNDNVDFRVNSAGLIIQ